MKEERGVEIKEKEEFAVEIKDGEFGILVDKDFGDKQPAECPPKQAEGSKLKSKGSARKMIKNSKSDYTKQEQKAKQDRDVAENCSKYGQLQEMQFKCKKCDKIFTIKRELVRHRKIIHEGETRMLKIREIQNL